MKGLKKGWLPPIDPLAWVPKDIGLKCSVPGLGELRHPIGLAAGFDKNAMAVAGLARLGFAFVEVGTVTPRAQPGNAPPRLMRLPDQRALINRLGFNNDGATQILERLKKTPRGACVIGANLGKNRTTPEERAAEDYGGLIENFAPAADFVVVNISSPNTPGLRELASVDFLRYLAEVAGPWRHKCWVKLDPDRSRDDFQELVAAVLKEQFAGLVLTNTHRVEIPMAGGLSGHPLLYRSTLMLDWAWEVHGGRLPVIGVGGILSGADIFHKMAHGANAVEIYTALIYRGPFVVPRLLQELSCEMRLAGISHLSDVYGMAFK